VTSALLVLSYSNSWLRKAELKHVYRWYEKLVMVLLESFVLKICI